MEVGVLEATTVGAAIILILGMEYNTWRHNMTVKTKDILKAIKTISEKVTITTDDENTSLQGVANAAAKVGGCQQGNLRELVTKLINYATEDEIELPTATTGISDYTKFKVVKVKSQGSGHTYKNGRLVMYLGNGSYVAMRRDGTVGNNLSAEYVTPVTDEEFEHYWEGLLTQTGKAEVKALVKREAAALITVE